MKEESYEAEIKCVSCGSNEFKLMRTTEHQILAQCVHCEEPHTLDAVDQKGMTSFLQFWSPKMEE